MRKLLIAILAVPVLTGVYATSVLGRSRVIRGGVAIALGAIVALGAISFARPAATTASPASDIAPLTQAAFRMAVATNIDLRAPASILFTTPMQRESVASSLSIQPPVPFELAWSADDTSVTIVPTANWEPSTYYTVSVGAGALGTSGRPMTKPVRTAFLTRDAATATLGATSKIAKRITIDSGFTIGFDQPVDLLSVGSSIRLDPPLTGALTRTTGPNGASTYTFIPASPLAPDTKYRMIVDGVRDAAGVEIAPITLALRTVAAPEVVRFRPNSGMKDMLRDATISVRFSKPMDRASVKKAFSATADGKRITGKVTFADEDTVLVFDPTSNLPYGASVVATVAPTARSADEVPLGVTKKATFTVVPKPAATKQQTSTRTTTRQIPRDGGGGGTVGGGSWGAVERYYLKLMNCTRTGGWVTSGGDCSSPGGRSVAALKLDTGISAKVARPYAKKLAVNNMCTHFSGGNPGDRLRRAGYTSYRWAENLGCRSGNPYSAVLGSHRFFQNEKPYNGGHYVNMMNAKYDRAGIGVWVSGGRVRLVVDFYHP
ncbi:MAG TPA: Ig-like domain-containing protein [Candidatus Limnocylindrales bacterium]|nr:Ig-like domain-containing protein [Candidatus Limnocylindrales bacterium]